MCNESKNCEPKTSDGQFRQRSTQHRAFFGRVSGKRLHAGQQKLFDSLLPKIQIDLPEQGFVDLPKIFGSNAKQNIVEIGYGGGEHLARIAGENPQNGFVGCEVFTGGIGKVLKTIDAQDLPNIKLFTQDAFRLLSILPDASLDAVYLLYPDPWPKLRHHKRRFVSNTTLAELTRVIKPRGTFRFATDIEDYANWTLAHMMRQPSFDWRIGAPEKFWHVPFKGWHSTRYEIKARKEGRIKSYYFTFERTA